MSVEFVGIELELRGEEGVYSDLKKIDQLLNSLGGKKKVDAGLDSLKRDIVAARGELEKFGRLRQQYLEAGGKGDAFLKEMQEARYHLRDLQQAQREVTLGARQMGDTFKQTFNKTSSMLTHAGSKMQSLGNALTKLTSPFERFTTGMIMGAGYKALGKFTEGLSNGFNRYDVMKKYPKIMAAFGYSAEEADASIQKLDQSVRGLPTGLDEMVDLTQRFTATTGDLEKGTKLAIATNNAFLASMSTDTQKYQGMMQLQDVLGGKDMNAREWNSLVSSMTPAIVKMGESLGYTSKNMGEFIQMVRSGEMGNDEFIDQLIKIGAEGGVLAQMAEDSKDTWQAFFANVGNAASRMTAGVVQGLDEISKTMTGMDVNLLLSNKVIPAIDDATAKVKEWIKAHPEEITNFFKDLSSINFGSFVKGLAEGMGELAGVVQKFARMFGGEDLSGLGKWIIRMNMAGKALTVMGGLLKGLSHPLAGIFTVFYRGGKAFKKKGLLGMLGELIVGEKASDAGKAGEAVEKLNLPKLSSLTPKLTKFFAGWAQVAAMIGGSALVASFSTGEFNKAMKSFKETVDIMNTVDWNMGAKAIGGLTVFLGAMAGLSGLAGHFASQSGTMLLGELVVGIFISLASGFADLNMRLIEDTLKQLKDAIKDLNLIIDGLNNIKDVPNAKEKIGNAITAFNELTKLFKGDFNADNKQWENGLKLFDKKFADSLENLSDALTDMESSIDSLNKINGMKLDTSNIEQLMSDISTAMEQVDKLYNMLPESISNGDYFSKGENINNSLTNIQGIFDKLVGENGILAKIPQIVQRMSSLQRSGNLDKFKSQMEAFGNALRGIWADLNLGTSNGSFNVIQLTNLETALEKVKEIIKKVNKLAGQKVDENGTGNIKKALEGIKNAFTDANVAGITKQINSFVESVKTALQAFEELNGEITIDASVKLSAGFGPSVNKVVEEIDNARTRIRTAWNRMPKILLRTINATVRANVNTAGAISAIQQGIDTVRSIADNAIANSNGEATGGMIYRAGGGSIPKYRRKGTDTVPAMLTPGEYVHNKRAVNLFGIDFMRKVNNLDMRGAMQELMIKAGNMAGAGRSTTINNYYNNNQKVTINNSNNAGAGFTFKAASRLAGAL